MYWRGARICPPAAGELRPHPNLCRGIRCNQDIIKAANAMVASNEPYVRCAAIVGLAGLLNVVFRSLV